MSLKFFPKLKLGFRANLEFFINYLEMNYLQKKLKKHPPVLSI